MTPLEGTNDGVVVLWPGLLLVVGPYGDHASWAISEDDKVCVGERQVVK